MPADSRQATIQVRLPADEKAAFEKILSQVGLSLASAVRIFAKKVIASREIPFSISAPRMISVSPEFAMPEEEVDELLETARRVDAGEEEVISATPEEFLATLRALEK
jgi:DNA-damage-inducible protein J